MTDAAYNALADLILSGPVGVATLCLIGVYLTLWKAQDKTVRLTLLHAFLVGFLGSLGWWVVDAALTRAQSFYACFGAL